MADDQGQQKKDLEKAVGNPPIIAIDCQCGETLYFHNPNGWKVAWMGRMEFQCPVCKRVAVFTKETMI